MAAWHTCGCGCRDEIERLRDIERRFALLELTIHCSAAALSEVLTDPVSELVPIRRTA